MSEEPNKPGRPSKQSANKEYYYEGSNVPNKTLLTYSFLDVLNPAPPKKRGRGRIKTFLMLFELDSTTIEYMMGSQKEKILNNLWEISKDGFRMVFVSTERDIISKIRSEMPFEIDASVLEDKPVDEQKKDILTVIEESIDDRYQAENSVFIGEIFTEEELQESDFKFGFVCTPKNYFSGKSYEDKRATIKDQIEDNRSIDSSSRINPQEESKTGDSEQPVKRGRGRPRKTPRAPGEPYDPPKKTPKKKMIPEELEDLDRKTRSARNKQKVYVELSEESQEESGSDVSQSIHDEGEEDGEGMDEEKKSNKGGSKSGSKSRSPSNDKDDERSKSKGSKSGEEDEESKSGEGSQDGEPRRPKVKMARGRPAKKGPSKKEDSDGEEFKGSRSPSEEGSKKAVEEKPRSISSDEYNVEEDEDEEFGVTRGRGRGRPRGSGRGRGRGRPPGIVTRGRSPAKRGRGRPRKYPVEGSRDMVSESGDESGEGSKKKDDSDDEGEKKPEGEQPKRKRGRPPKNKPKVEDDEEEESIVKETMKEIAKNPELNVLGIEGPLGEETKRKRGRPPKNSTSNKAVADKIKAPKIVNGEVTMEEIESFGSEEFQKIRKLNKIIAEKMSKKLETVNLNALGEEQSQKEQQTKDDKVSKQSMPLRRGLSIRSRNFEEKLYNDYENEILTKTTVEISDPLDLRKSFGDPSNILTRIKNIKLDQTKTSVSEQPILKKIKTNTLKKAETLTSINSTFGSNEVILEYKVKNPGEREQNIVIMGSDLEKLEPNHYLNDTLINFWLKFVANSLVDQNQKGSFHIFSTFMLEKLQNGFTDIEDLKAFERQYSSVAKWTKDVDIFAKDYLLFPYHDVKQQHWSLFIVCFPGKISSQSIQDEANTTELSMEEPYIVYFDSAASININVAKIIGLYLEFEFKNKKTSEYNKNSGQLNTITENRIHQLLVPFQENHNDCGVYLLEYAERFMTSPKEILTGLNESHDKLSLFPSSMFHIKREVMRSLIINLSKDLETAINEYTKTRAEKLKDVIDDPDEIVTLDEEAFRDFMLIHYECNVDDLDSITREKVKFSYFSKQYEAKVKKGPNGNFA